MSLAFTQNRIENSRKRVERFIDENIVVWVEDEILGPTQELGFSEGLSTRALGTMMVLKNGFMKAKISWTLKNEEGKPLHLFLERGTGPHIIRALGRLFGGKDSLKWNDAGGRPIFRKKVDHPGTRAMRIIERGYNQNKDKLKRRGIKEVNQFLEENKLG